jgi:GntR family transcriptional regulator of arabinose operon
MKTSPTPKPVSRQAIPLYQQVEHYLREQISIGSLRTGDMLPSVKELCEQFGGINHLTVRQAIKNLSEDNLVRSIQGRGSFVTEQATRHARIAIVLPHLEDTIFIRIAKGAQEMLETDGVRSLILDSRGSESIEADHIHNLTNLPVDGALIFPIAHSNIAEQIFKLKIDNFCFVLVDRYFEDIATSSVVADNYQGGYKSAKYLTDQGCQRVGWIGELRSTSARLRLKGFQDALNDADIACPNSLIKNVEVTPTTAALYHAALNEGVTKAVDELLAGSLPIDAIVCCDDASAIRVLARLQELGKKVPQEIALVGFDDIPDAASSTPALTTIRQPMIQIGREAAQMLMARMDDRDLPPEQKVLPVELIVRETA